MYLIGNILMSINYLQIQLDAFQDKTGVAFYVEHRTPRFSNIEEAQADCLQALKTATQYDQLGNVKAGPTESELNKLAAKRAILSFENDQKVTIAVRTAAFDLNNPGEVSNTQYRIEHDPNFISWWYQDIVNDIPNISANIGFILD